jgi:hypothetical protein
MINKQKVLDQLQEIANWLVCYSIATPEDMAGSFEYMYNKLEDTIDLINEKTI